MKARRVSVLFLILLGSLNVAAVAQESSPVPAPGQPAQERGQRGFGGMMGRGVMGTVTEVASDHFTIKTDTGEVYSIHYSVNTRVMKGGGGGQRRGQAADNSPAFNPPVAIKASDIKVGDAIGA